MLLRGTVKAVEYLCKHYEPAAIHVRVADPFLADVIHHGTFFSWAENGWRYKGGGYVVSFLDWKALIRLCEKHDLDLDASELLETDWAAGAMRGKT